jgi:hypothetical protein
MAKETEELTFFDFPIEHFPDRSTKWLLEFGENVRGLLEIVAGDLVDRLDFSQLRHVNKSFIPDNLREQESDIVYSVPFRGEDKTGEVWIYLLIEHQSTIDVTMGFRVLFYMVQIWDSQRREWEDNEVPKSQWRFRPILPIVFYTGENQWETPISMDAVMELPDALRRFVPTFDTLFLGVKASEEANLTKTDHPFGWLLTVIQKEGAEKQEIVSALKRMGEHISTLPEEELHPWKRAIFYLYLLIFHRRPKEEHDELKAIVHEQSQLLKLEKEEEQIMQTMAQHVFSQGEKQGEKRGENRGKLFTKREDLLSLLQLRFHSIPESVREKIASMRSLSRLDDLFRQVATAKTIDDIQMT